MSNTVSSIALFYSIHRDIQAVATLLGLCGISLSDFSEACGLILAFLVLGSPLYATQAQADLAGIGIDPQNLDFDIVADLDDILRRFDLLVGQLGNMQQTFQVRFPVPQTRRSWSAW